MDAVRQAARASLVAELAKVLDLIVDNDRSENPALGLREGLKQDLTDLGRKGAKLFTFAEMQDIADDACGHSDFARKMSPLDSAWNGIVMADGSIWLS